MIVKANQYEFPGIDTIVSYKVSEATKKTRAHLSEPLVKMFS
ncbi:hypothetical protein GGD38_006954 [Chitinophagaceae bacterium OAS944]|nr:hypothetical protein [Chitinophagaceae bacterium OAS944]